MKKWMIVAVLGLSACGSPAERSQGVCRHIPCESCRQQDELTQIHCSMVGGEFSPAASHWFPL